MIEIFGTDFRFCFGGFGSDFGGGRFGLGFFFLAHHRPIGKPCGFGAFFQLFGGIGRILLGFLFGRFFGEDLRFRRDLFGDFRRGRFGFGNGYGVGAVFRGFAVEKGHIIFFGQGAEYFGGEVRRQCGA